MAQTTLTPVLIRQLSEQPAYQQLVSYALFNHTATLLTQSGVDGLRPSAIGNKLSKQKKRRFSLQILTSGYKGDLKHLTWLVFTMLMQNNQTVDPEAINDDLGKIKAQGIAPIMDFLAHVEEGDETAPVESEAAEKIFGDGAPTQNADKIGQEFLDQTGLVWYKAVSTGQGAGDWRAINA